MCGIVGAVAERNVTGILIEGLHRLEYRGYDSAGMAVIDRNGDLAIHKANGKVAGLEDKQNANPIKGHEGIAHTRWATHGAPSEKNAHPHCSDHIAVVHNGIIENHQSLREALSARGYEFVSETDTEVVAHLIHSLYQETDSLKEAVKKALEYFDGAYALGVISTREPNCLIAARSGSPLVVGVGIEENFIASDQLALRQVTDRFIYLDEGDMAVVSTDSIAIEDSAGNPVERKITRIKEAEESADKGEYRHYMRKEIDEQTRVLGNTMQGRINNTQVLEAAFGVGATEVFDRVESVQIIACGTSYHAGMVARYWLEDWAGISCSVEVASEFRYRKTVARPNTLFVTISQSGETADTLAALRNSEGDYLASLVICNVANSSLVRESDLSLMTLAGPEIGVASTKAFTTQLVALQILAIALGRRHSLTPELETELVESLHLLPQICERVLTLSERIEQVSEDFAEKHHALFLGRGVEYPIAMEGALKLKEISYIHAEAYPAGELKHGPLALVDSDMPVIAVAPNNELLEKLKSNLEEVQARGGKLYVFADENSGFKEDENTVVVNLPHVPISIAPIVYTLPLQLLSYHVAVLKGTDVDQPRNLAKSVTVE